MICGVTANDLIPAGGPPSGSVGAKRARSAVGVSVVVQRVVAGDRVVRPAR